MDPEEMRYRISRAGIAELWGLVRDEGPLSVEKRVSLALALKELEEGRRAGGLCR